jgi:hypothetical protein
MSVHRGIGVDPCLTCQDMIETTRVGGNRGSTLWQNDGAELSWRDRWTGETICFKILMRPLQSEVDRRNHNDPAICGIARTARLSSGCVASTSRSTHRLGPLRTIPVFIRKAYWERLKRLHGADATEQATER